MPAKNGRRSWNSLFQNRLPVLAADWDALTDSRCHSLFIVRKTPMIEPIRIIGAILTNSLTASFCCESPFDFLIVFIMAYTGIERRAGMLEQYIVQPFRSASFRTFPLIVFGSCSTNSMARIHLYSASFLLQKSLISSSSSREGAHSFRRTTTPLMACPRRVSGTPMTVHSDTAGCSIKICSTS